MHSVLTAVGAQYLLEQRMEVKVAGHEVREGKEEGEDCGLRLDNVTRELVRAARPSLLGFRGARGAWPVSIEAALSRWLKRSGRMSG